MRRSPALWLVVAAVLVTGPRLVLAFLAADRVPVDAGDRRLLLQATAWATALVLTVGAAYLAHAAARLERHRGLLVATWLVILTSSGLLIAPLLVASLEGHELHQVLSQPWARIGWSALAVLAVEFVAGGAMVAHAAGSRLQDELAGLYSELEDVARARDQAEGDAAQARRILDQETERARRLLDQQRAFTALVSGPLSPAQPGSPRLVPTDPVPCRNACGKEFSSTRAEAGHQRACPDRQTEPEEESPWSRAHPAAQP